MTPEEFRYQMDMAIYTLVLSLPPAEAAAIENTRWLYAARPTAADMAGFPPTSTLLGLYTAPREYSRAELLDPSLPPPTITLFAGNILALGYTAKQVVTHEAGHRLGYDHGSAPVIPCGTERSALPEVVRAVTSRTATALITCGC